MLEFCAPQISSTAVEQFFRNTRPELAEGWVGELVPCLEGCVH